MNQTPCILIVEDEPSIRDMIVFALDGSGFQFLQAQNVKEARDQIANQLPDVILLDWMLPGISGIDFATELKQNPLTRHIRIIMLTARAEEENKIKGFDSGVDDYIAKPFSTRELKARIQAILRRGSTTSFGGVLTIGKLNLKTDTHVLEINHETISLTSIEYKLLHFLMTHPNRIYTREQLLSYVWGFDDNVTDRTVDVHIRRLRKHLERHHCEDYIKTIRSHGYQFVGATL